MTDIPPAGEKNHKHADHFWRASLRALKPEEIRAQVLQAVESGDNWRFNILMQLELDEIDARDYMKAAVESGRMEMLEALLQRFSFWKDNGNLLQDLAEKAALSGRMDMLKTMVETKKVDLHAHEDYFLRQSAENGHIDIVIYLLDQGADPNARDAGAVTGAAGTGQLEIVRLLVAAGADSAFYAREALEAAAQNGHPAVVSWLLKEKREECEQALEQALVSACREGHTGCVEILIKAGASVGDDNDAALKDAIYYGHFGVAELLLENGADVNAENGAPLRRAAYRGEIETLRFLLAKGADPNVSSGSSRPLMEAVDGGYIAAVTLLLENGADPTHRNFQALKKARAERKTDIAKLIIQNSRQGAELEKLRKQQEFRETFGMGYTLDDLRNRRGVSGDTGLLLAARSGKFSELVQGARGEGRLVAEDLFHPDNTVDMVLSVLARQKDLPQFFDSALWDGRHEEVTRAWKMLPEKYQKRVSLNAANAAHDISEIRQKAKRINRQPPRL